MNTDSLRIIHKDDIATGGFAGIIETKMVLSPKVWADAKNKHNISHGLGDFIYLANGYFKPNEGVPMHPHRNVDIVSLILNGKVGHAGTLGDGTVIEGRGVQVQRSGTGMQHSEFNMTDEKARIIQLWFLPPKNNLTPSYQNFAVPAGKMTTVLGGADTFDSNIHCQVGDLNAGESIQLNQDAIVLMISGQARVQDAKQNQQTIYEGHLIEGNHLNIQTSDGCGLVIVQTNESHTLS